MPLTEKGTEIMSHMRKEYGSPEKAKEVFYASKNAGKITGVDTMGISEMGGMDSVPIGSCYGAGSKDEAPAYNSVPLVDPTAIGGLGPYGGQPSGMKEPSDGAHGEAAALKAGPTGPEIPPGHRRKDGEIESSTDEWGNAPAAPHGGCDPAMSFDAHDYTGDVNSHMGGLPETISQKEMVNFAASMNYGEGVTK
jgi:hypothetical protein